MKTSIRQLARSGALLFALSGTSEVVAGTFSNPFIPADVPDISIVRVGTMYYMSSTTMHMCPGLPIMESPDMVHWRMASYAYDTLGNVDAMTLANGKEMYGNGSWASSLRYNKGTFWALVSSNTTGKTYLYKTSDVHKTPWTLNAVFNALYYDPSLFFDDDGTAYIACQAGNVKLIQLNSTLTAASGINTTIVTSSQFSALNATGLDEGSHLEKVNGWYYLFNIANPGVRTVTCFRSKSITGPYEGKIVLQDKGGHDGVAQGSVLQMADSSWMGYFFTDHGAVGRLPWLVPATWSSNWPDFNGGKAPTSFTLANVSAKTGYGVVTSDDFTSPNLALEWQWNHNPDPKNWSLTARPGYYRITNSRVDAGILTARNTLSQRSLEMKCSGRIALDASGLKDGNIAGLAAFQDSLGYVAVKNTGGALSVITSRLGKQEGSVAIAQKRVYLRIDMDFNISSRLASFYYSTDSTTWKPIGNSLHMVYTLGMFVGYRFALFSHATKAAGGYADFDWYKIGGTSNESIVVNSQSASGVVPFDRPSTRQNWARIALGRENLRLAYALEKASQVDIHLVSARGRILQRLESGHRSAGEHVVETSWRDPGEPTFLVSRLDGRMVESKPIALVR